MRSLNSEPLGCYPDLMMALSFSLLMPLAAAQAAAVAPSACESPPPQAEAVQVPAARVGRQYAFRVQAQGGQPPYTYAVSVGNPEAIGLTLGADGLLAGVPTAPGELAFVVVVRNAQGCAEAAQRYQLRVLPEP